MKSNIRTKIYAVILAASLCLNIYQYNSYKNVKPESEYVRYIESRYADMGQNKICVQDRYDKVLLIDTLLRNLCHHEHPSYLLKNLNTVGVNPSDIRELVIRIRRRGYKTIEKIVESTLTSPQISNNDLRRWERVFHGLYDYYFARPYIDILRLWRFTYNVEIQYLNSQYNSLFNTVMQEVENTLYVETLVNRIAGI